jgi:hypothetical protein
MRKNKSKEKDGMYFLPLIIVTKPNFQRGASSFTINPKLRFILSVLHFFWNALHAFCAHILYRMQKSSKKFSPLFVG